MIYPCGLLCAMKKLIVRVLFITCAMLIGVGSLCVGTIVFVEFIMGPSKEDPLCAAVRSGKRQEVEKWLGRSRLADCKCRVGSFPVTTKWQRPIHVAAASGRIDIVKELINAGADVDERDSNDETALIHAVMSDSARVVGCLIDEGAAVDAQVGDGAYTALHYAALLSATDALRECVRRGGDVNARDRLGRTPLHLVRDVEAVRALIEVGADPNSQDNDGNTPLHAVAGNVGVSAREMCAVLIDSGADTAIVNRKGISAADVIRRMNKSGE